jgi:hypothetical protein
LKKTVHSIAAFITNIDYVNFNGENVTVPSAIQNATMFLEEIDNGDDIFLLLKLCM